MKTVSFWQSTKNQPAEGHPGPCDYDDDIDVNSFNVEKYFCEGERNDEKEKGRDKSKHFASLEIIIITADEIMIIQLW